eukprot:gene6868-62785_t
MGEEGIRARGAPASGRLCVYACARTLASGVAGMAPAATTRRLTPSPPKRKANPSPAAQGEGRWPLRE